MPKVTEKRPLVQASVMARRAAALSFQVTPEVWQVAETAEAVAIMATRRLVSCILVVMVGGLVEVE